MHRLAVILIVVAKMVVAGSDPDKLSNELTVKLPLKVEDIVLPPDAVVVHTPREGNEEKAGDDTGHGQPDVEKDDNDIYKEYIEIDPLTDAGNWYFPLGKK